MSTRAGTPLARFLLRNFVKYNPLFVFSAMLVLGGAWLLNPPQAHGGRGLPLLLQLLGVIQLYEFTLLGAACVLWKKANLARDVRFLMLVLAPFLLDVTFTTSSTGVTLLSQHGPGAAFLLALAVLSLTGIKLKAAAVMTGQRFESSVWAALLFGPALVTVTPILGAYLALSGHGYAVGFACGGLLAALILQYASLAGEEGGRGTLRRVAPLILLATLAHTLATTWAYSGSIFHVLGPVLIALGPALPRLAPQLRDHEQVSVFALPLVGAVLCGISGDTLVHGSNLGTLIGLTGWQLALVAVGALHGLMFHRHRSLHFLAGLLFCAHLAWGGATLSGSFGAIGDNPLEPFLLLALFGYGVWRKSPAPAVAVPLLLSAVLAVRHEPFGNALDVLLALQLVGAGTLVYAHRVFGKDAAGARFRFVGTFLLFFPPHLLALGFVLEPQAQELARVFAWSSVLALFGLAALTRLRGYALPALLIPLELAIRFAPSSTQGWGVLGLLLAFVVVSLGVLLSLKREQILAWLNEAEEREAELGQPLAAPEESMLPDLARQGAATLALGLVVAFLVGVA